MARSRSLKFRSNLIHSPLILPANEMSSRWTEQGRALRALGVVAAVLALFGVGLGAIEHRAAPHEPRSPVTAWEETLRAPQSEARPVSRLPVPRVRAQAAIIFDPVSGETLWERNSRDLRSIASITKVMTVMLFLEGDPDLTRDVVISRQDVRRASTTYLRRGERVTLRDLVHLALVASDNAAARALARVSPWGTKRFIARMNAMAAELGLEQTRFADPSGLHEGNVSSAYDVSKLISAASKEAVVAEIMRKRAYDIRTSRRTRTIRSTNRLLGTRVDVMAGKTGYIDEAGYCLATLVQLADGRSVSVVVLGARSNSGRFAEARRLVDWLSTKATVLLTSAAE